MRPPPQSGAGRAGEREPPDACDEPAGILLGAQLFFVQPAGLWTRTVEAGFAASLSAGRRGRLTSSPPQFGQIPSSFLSAHAAQKVHSKVQMRASVESGGRSRSQHSHPGRIWSIERSVLV